MRLGFIGFYHIPEAEAIFRSLRCSLWIEGLGESFDCLIFMSLHI
jgi:hypothetical protein